MAPPYASPEHDALRLPARRRARLAMALLSSLDRPAGTPAEVERLWIAEAELRLDELRRGAARGLRAERVLETLRSEPQS